jgi:anti-sigma factor RsiW
MKHDEQLELQAYLDGELDSVAAARVEARLAADVEGKALLAELRMVKEAVIQGEPAAKVPETRDFYWSKIARAIEAEEKVAAKSQSPAVPVWAWVRRLVPALGIATVVALVLLSQSPAGNGPGIAAAGENGETFHIEADGMTVVWVN